MAAQKARSIHKVEEMPEASGRWFATVAHDGYPESVVTLESLSRVELIRAAAFRGIDSRGGWATAGWKNHHLIAAIKGEEVILDSPDPIDAPAPMPAPILPPMPAVIEVDAVEVAPFVGTDTRDAATIQHNEPAPIAPAPVAPIAPAATSLDAVIATVAEAAASKVVADALSTFDPIDMDAVRAIVADEVDALRPTVITIGTNEPVTITGRTHPQFERVLRLMTAPTPKPITPFLVGPAGTGKTFLARQVADALDLRCIVISCHPMMTRAEMIGYMSPGTNEEVAGPLAEGWRDERGAVVVFDELDAAHPAALVTLNDCLASTPGTLLRMPNGEQIPRSDRLHFIGTANTFGTGPTAEYVGRNALDAATLDRFYNVAIDYDVELEHELCKPFLNGSTGRWMDAVSAMRRNVTEHKIRTVISTRGVNDVAVAVSIGETIDDAVADRLLKGIGPDQSRKVLEGVKLAGVA